MQIKTPQSGLLTNHEVLLHMQSEAADYHARYGTEKPEGFPTGLNAMLRDSLSYLTSPDLPLTTLTSTHPSRPMTLYKGPNSLFRALGSKYKLNKAEYLQIYNLRPTSEVMLGLVLEEADTRFSRKQQAEILSIIAEVFAEEESRIPERAEDQEMEKIKNKLEGAGKRRRKVVIPPAGWIWEGREGVGKGIWG
ncbi:hypothetical protein BCR34DRAFT_608566 [Clohesyomyces aquaticus]|uniref:DNA-directed RNA polymerase III subunit RPC9 n=1 Tax=Clohesyomyces aquaticus TaxID=1231657 RepID=A0A1Y1Y631_9PLEO|nr:hypothetical protein BCR34DRAFT_608566 [Clohesyomyces aquaticus]